MTNEEKAVYLKLKGWIQVPMEDIFCIGLEEYAWRPENNKAYMESFKDKVSRPALLWTNQAYEIEINNDK